jgi:hypothetical protein
VQAAGEAIERPNTRVARNANQTTQNSKKKIQSNLSSACHFR